MPSTDEGSILQTEFCGEEAMKTLFSGCADVEGKGAPIRRFNAFPRSHQVHWKVVGSRLPLLCGCRASSTISIADVCWLWKQTHARVNFISVRSDIARQVCDLEARGRETCTMALGSNSVETPIIVASSESTYMSRAFWFMGGELHECGSATYVCMYVSDCDKDKLNAIIIDRRTTL